eukprot:s1936_g12.t2
MSQLHFKRLVKELRTSQQALKNGDTSLLRVEPVEDNMMDWEVDMVFPSDSPLQKSLDSLAESMFDETLKNLTLSVRFPVEYPLSPPEVWLRRPRLQHSPDAGAVTFGGRVCSMILASRGWNPATSMVDVLKEVRQSLLDSGIVAYSTVTTKKEYPKPAIQLERLSSEIFATANGFCQDGMTVLSAEAAVPFLGDLSRLEATDKIALPFSYANQIYQRAERGQELQLPLTFEVTTKLGRKTHCAIFEFINGLPDMHVLLPKWVMDDLGISERELVRVRGVVLQLINAVQIQPHSVDFYEAVRQSGREVQLLLTESLARFSCLTEDTAVPIDVGGSFFNVQITKLQPHGAVRIIDTDVQHHFEFKVDFEPAPDLEDEAAKKDLEDRCLAARRQRYDALRAAAAAAAKAAAEKTGEAVDIALRMPNGSQVKGHFLLDAPIACLVAKALESDWAQEALPWGIHLRMAYPRKVLKDGDVITKDFHRCTLSVQEEQAPEDDELLAALAAPSATPEEAKQREPEAMSSELPELNEEEAMARTQRAFEIQRYLRAGVSLEEAERKYASGEVLPPTDESRRPAPAPPAAAVAPAPPRLERTRSEEEQRQFKVEMVVNFTGVDAAVAQVALEDQDWVVESAINSLLDNMG